MNILNATSKASGAKLIYLHAFANMQINLLTHYTSQFTLFKFTINQ